MLSDEIHCDLTDPGYEYIPFASVSKECKENSITCIAPTKSFNLAGLQTAAVVIPNPYIRHKVVRGLNTDEVAEPNSFAIEGTIAAFSKGEIWLEELRRYLLENKKYAQDFLIRELPQVSITPSNATYLLWINCREVIGSATEMCKFIRKHNGLVLSAGSVYGKEGEGFIRMNIGCPKKLVEDGLKRLKEGILAYEKWVVEQC